MSSQPEPKQLDLEYYKLQVGGHGETDETGLITLYNGSAIAKPLLPGLRSAIEANFYRDIMISYVTHGNFPPHNFAELHENNDINVHESHKQDYNSNEVESLLTGWFCYDYVLFWKNYSPNQLQLPYLQYISTQMIKHHLNSLSINNHTTIFHNLQHALNFMLRHELPHAPSYTQFINTTCHTTAPPQFPTLSCELSTKWYYRSLLAKATCYPTPLGCLLRPRKTLPVVEPKKTPLNPTPEIPQDPHHPYIVLESLTKAFTHAAVVDIKMGQQTWDYLANYLKISYELSKCPVQQEIGFRVVGINVPIVYNKVTLGEDNKMVIDSVVDSKYQVDRRIGQAFHIREEIVDVLHNIFETLTIPPYEEFINIIESIKNNENIPKTKAKPYKMSNEWYLHYYNTYDEASYHELYITRQTLIKKMICLLYQQLQEILLLLSLYPTHFIIASSILITFEANPHYLEEMMENYQAFYGSIETADNSTNLGVLLKKYSVDKQWLTSSHNESLDISPISQDSQNLSTTPPQPPILVKLIDVAHVYNPREHMRQMNVALDNSNLINVFNDKVIDKIIPLYQKYVNAHLSSENSPGTNLILPHTSKIIEIFNANQQKGDQKVDSKELVYTMPYALAVMMRHEISSKYHRKYINQSLWSELLECDGCCNSNTTSKPSYLPHMYSYYKLTQNTDINLSAQIPYKNYFGGDKNIKDESAEHWNNDVGFYFLNTCDKHENITFTDADMLDLVQSHIGSNKRPIPAFITPLLPQEVITEYYKQITFTSIESDVLSNFYNNRDSCLMNGIKSAMAYFLHLVQKY